MRYPKFRRIELGLTQRRVAALTNGVVPQSVLCYIETGRIIPNDKEKKALAKVLGCKPEQLLTHVDPSPLGDGAEFADAREAK